MFRPALASRSRLESYVSSQSHLGWWSQSWSRLCLGRFASRSRALTSRSHPSSSLLLQKLENFTHWLSKLHVRLRVQNFWHGKLAVLTVASSKLQWFNDKVPAHFADSSLSLQCQTRELLGYVAELWSVTCCSGVDHQET